MPTITLSAHMKAGDAAKVDQLVARCLGDIGSIYMRAFWDPQNPTPAMPPELVGLRTYLREVQDSVRERFPEVFYK